MTELFKDSEVSKPSPRLEWCKRHNLALGEFPDGVRFCASPDLVCIGETHRDAELKMAEEMGVEHWSVEEFKRAGVAMKEKAVTENWD